MAVQQSEREAAKLLFEGLSPFFRKLLFSIKFEAFKTAKIPVLKN